MANSREFSEMLKIAYNSKMDNVDFYTRMAQIAPSDSISRALVQVSRDELRHSFLIDSIMSLTPHKINSSTITAQECNCPYAEPTYSIPAVLDVPTLQPVLTNSNPVSMCPNNLLNQAPYQMAYDITNIPIPNYPYMIPATQEISSLDNQQNMFNLMPTDDIPSSKFMTPAIEKLLIPESLPDPEPESKCPAECDSSNVRTDDNSDKNN